MFPRFCIPQSHRLVPTPTGKCAAIWAERYAVDPRPMPCECVLMFPVSASHSRTVLSLPPLASVLLSGTERYAFDLSRMTGEQGDPLKRRRIVEPNTDRTGDGKPSAVRGIGDVIYRAFTQPRFSAIG